MNAIKPTDLTILRYPAAVLRERAKAVAKIDDQVRAVADRMIELMLDVEGLGLAAPQVGLALRLAVINVTPEIPQRFFLIQLP